MALTTDVTAKPIKMYGILCLLSSLLGNRHLLPMIEWICFATEWYLAAISKAAKKVSNEW